MLRLVSTFEARKSWIDTIDSRENADNKNSSFVPRSKDISRRSTKREYCRSRLQIGDTRSIRSTYDVQTILAMVTTRRTPLLLVSFFYQVRLVVYPAKPSRIDASATVAVMARPRKILYMRRGEGGRGLPSSLRGGEFKYKWKTPATLDIFNHVRSVYESHSHSAVSLGPDGSRTRNG